MNIKAPGIVKNVDHVHLFIKYPPKHSVSYIAKRLKGRGIENCTSIFTS